MGRAALRTAVVGVGLLSALVAGTGSASAHAVLEATSPAAGSVLARAPARVVLTFGEPVTVTPGDLRVYDAALQRVDARGAYHPGGRGPQVAVDLRGHLPDGTYAVTWRVTSADTHVVSGGFRFSVGAASRLAGTVPGLAANNAARVLLAVCRAVDYAGLAAGAGAFAVLLAWWPGGLGDRRIRRLLTAGAALVVGSTAISLVAQAAYATGRPLAAALTPSVLHAGLAGRFGVVMLARLTLAVALSVLGVLAVRAWRRPVTVPGLTGTPSLSTTRVGAAVLGLALLASWPAAGHAGTGPQAPLAFAAALAHVTAMTVWFGGLAVLTVGLLPGARADELARVLPGFSGTAFTAVTVLVATGSYQAWREVGSWAALSGTGYGRLLLAKLVGVVALVGLGRRARRWVQRHYRTHRLARVVHARVDGAPAAVRGDAAEPPKRAGAALATLRRGVLAEVGVGVGVLAVTAVLVASQPARDAYAAPYSRTLAGPNLTVQVTVDPAHTGLSTIHLYTENSQGSPTPLTSVTGALRLPARDVGPLPVAFTRLAPNHAQAASDFAVPGRWLLDLTVQTSPVDATTFRLPVTVR